MDTPSPADRGTAGASAAREAERWRARRTAEKESRSRIARALFGASAQEKQMAVRETRWATGSRGETMLAESLARRCPGVVLLHDRRIPRSRANIDHIAVAPSGVYVIDAKRYRGKIHVRRPLFHKEKLTIAGRDRTTLLAGLERQVTVVTAVLGDTAPEAAVHGCLCFVPPEGLLADSGLPAVRTLKVGEVPLYSPRRLAKRLNRPGPMSPERIAEIAATLADGLPPA